MKWFQKIFAVIALLNMALAPSALAISQWTAKEQVITQYRDYLEPLGYTLTLDPENKKALVYQKGTSTVVMEIPFAKESHLRKFSPKSMNQMMLNEMVRIKSASQASWSHSVRSLPAESAIFFVAMGAVVAGQLINNYSQNPVAMQQHVEHSMSPIGVFGFFTFMYSQGVTANVLSMYMKNPKFHHMIPYLGMTVGAFLQTYLSQIASDPNVMACARVMMGQKLTEQDMATGIEEDPCARAYEYLVVQKKIWEFAPGIVSMLISSGIAGVAQSVLTKTVLRITGVDIALWLMPGTMQLKAIRLLLVKGLQITAFVAIDVWLNRNVTSVWKNMYDGADFYEQNDRLNQQINLMKTSAWKSDDKALQAEIKDFRTKMTNWRMMNMSEVYEAHQNWQEQLHQMTAMFNSSYAFYSSITTEIRNVRFDESSYKPLISYAPLTGITAKDLAEGKEDLYLLNPQFVHGMQLDTVAEAANILQEIISGPVTQEELYPREAAHFKQALAAFRSGDETKIGEAIRLLQKMKTDGETGMQGSINVLEHLRKVLNSLGDATPSSGVGQGYLTVYAKAPSSGEPLRGTSYYRVAGAFQTPRITDYLIMQMLCGPDLEAGDSAIRTSQGYPSVFLPPTIIDNSQLLPACNNLGSNLPIEELYTFRMQNSSGKMYHGVIPYLVGEARSSVVGIKDQIKFDSWWKNKTEVQVTSAFEQYAKSYDEIVVKMVKAIYYPGRNFSNGRHVAPLKAVDFINSETARHRFFSGGPIFNGGMNSAFQEERVYLSLLEELMKPSSQFKMDISTILEKVPNHASLKEVDNQFTILNGMIKRIKIINKDGREVIQSDLENYQLEEQLTKIQEALAKVSTVLGVGDETIGAQFTLNQQQRDLAVTSLEQLQSLASEVMMYGSMANAVSWEKIRDLKRVNMEQQQFNNDIQKALLNMRGMSLTGGH